MRKVLCIVLSMVMICTFLFSPILTNPSSAATIKYAVNGGELIFDPVRGYITGYTGSPVNVTVPAKINGYKVIGLSVGLFSDCASLTSVTLPEGLLVIDEHVFWNCDNLAQLNIPNSVSYIGNAFTIYSNSLNSITVEADNKYYTTQDGVLFNRNKTVLIRFPGGKGGEYTIPSSVTSIGRSAFYGNQSITKITIPDGVKSIGDEAFTNCFHIREFILPDSLESIGFGVFRDSGASKIIVGNNNIYFTSVDGVLFNKNKTALMAYPGQRPDTCYEVPEGVKSIADFGLASCHNLTEIHFPESLKNVGAFAVAYCEDLSKVIFYGDAPSVREFTFIFASPELGIYYFSGKKNFTNPWCDYPTEAVAPKPDIVISDIKWSPSDPIQGDNITFSAIVKNKGNAQFNSGMVKSLEFYVDGQLAASAGTNITAIKPGESLTLNADTTWTAVNGEHKVSASVVAKMDESNPDNNSIDKTLTISQFRGASSWAVSYLEIAVEMGFITDALKSRPMNSGITREEFASVSVKFYEKVTGNTAVLPKDKTFVDCDNPEVLKAFTLNITTGVGDGTRFDPKAILSRQQMAAMITRTLKATYPGIVLDTSGQSDFKDQAKFSQYAIESAKFMAKLGITTGDGKGNFNPTSNCSIEQTIIFLIRAYQLKDSYSYQ